MISIISPIGETPHRRNSIRSYSIDFAVSIRENVVFGLCLNVHWNFI